MRILKLVKNSYGHCYVMFDEIPQKTFEKIGIDYVGSYEENGKVILSWYLKKERFGDAFGGREINLNIKDGTVKTIKDYWFDCGSYPEHGEFINIGAGTLEDLQRCFVFCSMNINKEAFENMVEEYLKRDKIYEYDEVEKWSKLQYTWYDVIVNGKKIPYMMNKYGGMVEKESKKYVYPRYNKAKKVKGEWKEYHYFKFNYKEDGRLVKIESNYLEVLKNTLPFSEEEIRKYCKIS